MAELGERLPFFRGFRNLLVYRNILRDRKRAQMQSTHVLNVPLRNPSAPDILQTGANEIISLGPALGVSKTATSGPMVLQEYEHFWKVSSPNHKPSPYLTDFSLFRKITRLESLLKLPWQRCTAFLVGYFVDGFPLFVTMHSNRIRAGSDSTGIRRSGTLTGEA